MCFVFLFILNCDFKVPLVPGSFLFSPCRLTLHGILVPRGSAPFGQHQESRPLARSNNGSPRFTDFPSLRVFSESSLTKLIGSGLNLLCLPSHSKPECRWTWPEVVILGADQKERGLWGREWLQGGSSSSSHEVTVVAAGTGARPPPYR